MSRVAALVFTLVLAGCADNNVRRLEAPIVPVVVGETASVPATDLAKAMIRAGFTREEILRYGPGVRNAIAKGGGAEVQEGGLILALFSVQDGRLYVSSRRSGTVIQPLSGSPHYPATSVVKS